MNHSLYGKKITLQQLSQVLEGSIRTDDLHRSIYSTDASVYRKIPLGVAYPQSVGDLKKLIAFANENGVSLIPRTAGTSLAGQCVGSGLIVDVSKHFTRIIDYKPEEKTVTLEPGVIRDDLNRLVKADNLFFGPNTSTANRCMMGGMVGNNSSGTTSIRYGVTRDKVLRLKTLLSDGSEAVFESLTVEEFLAKSKLDSLEGRIYKTILTYFSKPEVQEEIIREFPKSDIHRRCTGYAIDEILKFELFGGNEPTFNVAKLLCGSEGTLAFTMEITLQLDSLPPKHSVMVVSHFSSIAECLESVVVAMKHHLYNCELMDKLILDCTKSILSQQENRRFLEGDPAAVLMLEMAADSMAEAETQADKLVAELKEQGFGYAHPKLVSDKILGVHELRKAGLGALGNLFGDKKAVACIEDTAVSIKDLSSFIADFAQMMKEFGQESVYYAHAGAGEIHLRPILNLKTTEDVVLFRKITTRVAELVKRYQGSLSGEHGDGIVRAEFLPMMVGEKNYQVMRALKNVFDPNCIFNEKKIIDSFAMDDSLRYEVGRGEPQVETLMNFSNHQGILRLAEQCNGSGDCRKSASAKGMMCPSYQVTKDEKDTTRARANALREVLTNNKAVNKFNSETLKQVFDLCVACKACASECPSSVDAAILKSEFLYQYQEANGYSLRNQLITKASTLNFGTSLPGIERVTNVISNTLGNTGLVKKILGISKKRSLPVGRPSLKGWVKTNLKRLQLENPIKWVYFFIDEFINRYDTQVGMDVIELLYRLNYQCVFLNHAPSGRAYISKGFLQEAKKMANLNIAVFGNQLSEQSPLVGVEPSAILSFRDEYLRLSDQSDLAKQVAKHTFTIEEFISKEIELGNIQSSVFTTAERKIDVHVHCHQKALGQKRHTFNMLNIVPNYHVTVLDTGCCGMAGSFGYEEKHYDVSMKMGELTLFPLVRNALQDTIIVAAGTSCRHQINDAVKRDSLHPASVLLQALE